MAQFHSNSQSIWNHVIRIVCKFVSQSLHPLPNYCEMKTPNFAIMEHFDNVVVFSFQFKINHYTLQNIRHNLCDSLHA